MPPDNRFEFCRECYDFSDVPDEELENCVHYEYMRESKTVWAALARLARIKDERKEIGFRDLIPQDTYGALTAAVVMLAHIKGGLDLPWQKLSRKRKQELRDINRDARRFRDKIAEKENPMLVLDTTAKNAALKGKTLGEWWQSKLARGDVMMADDKAKKKVVLGFIRMDLSCSHAQLVEAFCIWLIKHFPQPYEKAKEARGRKAWRDALNALGALRLRYYCRTLKEAQKLIAPLEAKPTGMHYSDRTAWKRACETARKYFDRVLPLKGELPMHYTKGWQK